MPAITSPEVRFREFRERAGLSRDDAAQQMGISAACIWDIEDSHGELSQCYSPDQVRRFCRVLNIYPKELFAVETADSPLSAGELVRLVHNQCRSRAITLEQFEDEVGWRLSTCIEPPERLLQDITIDGLQSLCRELGVDWHRVILSL